MLDHVLAREGFRQRLLSLVVATTGTTTLSATSTGFARTAGSFLTDGFAAGMEVVPAGFSAPNNAPAIIDTVSGLALTIAGGRTVEAAASSRSLSVGLPQLRQWQGTQNPTTNAPGTIPFVVEQWVPGATFDDGAIIDTGFYVVTWNALPNRGIVATFRQMQAMRDLYPPGWSFYVGADKVRVTGSPAPQFTAPVRIATGYEMSTLRVPWRSVTTNLSATAVSQLLVEDGFGLLLENETQLLTEAA